MWWPERGPLREKPGLAGLFSACRVLALGALLAAVFLGHP